MPNAAWDLIEPFLPVADTGPLPRRARELFNGVLWRFALVAGGKSCRAGRALVHGVLAVSCVGVGRGVPGPDGGLIAEAASRGQAGLELVSVESTIVRAYRVGGPGRVHGIRSLAIENSEALDYPPRLIGARDPGRRPVRMSWVRPDRNEPLKDSFKLRKVLLIRA